MFAAAWPLATGTPGAVRATAPSRVGRDLDTDNVTRSELVIGGHGSKLPVGFLSQKLIPKWIYSGSGDSFECCRLGRSGCGRRPRLVGHPRKDLRSEMLAVLIRVHHRRRLSLRDGGGGAGACATTGFAALCSASAFSRVLNFLAGRACRRTGAASGLLSGGLAGRVAGWAGGESRTSATCLFRLIGLTDRSDTDDGQKHRCPSRPAPLLWAARTSRETRRRQ